MDVINQKRYSLSRTISLQTINPSNTHNYKTFLNEARQTLINLMNQNAPCKMQLILRCEIYTFKSSTEYINPNIDVSSIYSRMINEIIKTISNKQINSIDCLEIYTIKSRFENPNTFTSNFKNEIIKKYARRSTTLL